jgi:hypothetical protein
VDSQELLNRLIALDPENYGNQYKRTLQADQALVLRQCAAVPGERSITDGNQAEGWDKG